MKKLYANYIESFTGLSKEIWYLSLISLVNRAGTMIIPFISLYLINELKFSDDDAGWILVFFGIGSVLGGFIGGKLTDKIGFYKVMILSLLLTGIGFIGLQYITSFWGLCIIIFLIMTVADTFRPAIFVSIKAYSKPENQTKSLALIRLAINLGMGIGPTIAGYIIVVKGYGLLFWIDGITCILAIILFYILVKEKQNKLIVDAKEFMPKEKNTIYKDFSYWIFIAICFFMGMTFFQLIFTMPIYMVEEFCLTEFDFSLIMLINIVIIVLFEMPLLHYLKKKNIEISRYITLSCILFSLGFFILYNNLWLGILIVNIILLTLGEMLGFPYSNTFALKRAKEGFEGSYMSFYAMSFSLAIIFSPKIGLSIVDSYGYQINWLVTGGFGGISVLLSFWLNKRIKNNL